MRRKRRERERETEDKKSQQSSLYSNPLWPPPPPHAQLFELTQPARQKRLQGKLYNFAFSLAKVEEGEEHVAFIEIHAPCACCRCCQSVLANFSQCVINLQFIFYIFLLFYLIFLPLALAGPRVTHLTPTETKIGSI